MGSCGFGLPHGTLTLVNPFNPTSSTSSHLLPTSARRRSPLPSSTSSLLPLPREEEVEEVVKGPETVVYSTAARAEVNSSKTTTKNSTQEDTMADPYPTLCALCSKPLPSRTGVVWKAAPGVWTHMNSGCPASFSVEAHDALLPDCHEDHDLFEHCGVMCWGGLAVANAHERGDMSAQEV